MGEKTTEEEHGRRNDSRGAGEMRSMGEKTTAEEQRSMGEKKVIVSHRELEVYNMAFEVATEIFEETKKFPIEERYLLTDQIRRSLRSVYANITEA